MTGARIDKAGIRLDRKRPLNFRFNGRSYQGFAGDTLASAVLAAGAASAATASTPCGRSPGL